MTEGGYGICCVLTQAFDRAGDTKLLRRDATRTSASSGVSLIELRRFFGFPCTAVRPRPRIVTCAPPAAGYRATTGQDDDA